MKLVKNSYIYWEFIRNLRNMDGVRQGFIEQDIISKESHEQYMKKNSEFFYNVYGNGHKKFYIDLEKSINKNIKFPVSEKDCINTIKFLHSFYLSNHKSKKISFAKVHDFYRLGEKNEKISKLYRYQK